ncbi:hypothetical protein GOP47_0021980 [Adiantum capillus-veneris]|uniref:Uncharacterized protein n=1 Tax=Adiantum capillus-veneris TaxID=13818 RepID=A0A9D4U8I3_ADICA|nr:hypothetical protein GOP47_0021980 [Adiantum capillus-veneris]
MADDPLVACIEDSNGFQLNVERGQYATIVSSSYLALYFKLQEDTMELYQQVDHKDGGEVLFGVLIHSGHDGKEFLLDIQFGAKFCIFGSQIGLQVDASATRIPIILFICPSSWFQNFNRFMNFQTNMMETFYLNFHHLMMGQRVRELRPNIVGTFGVEMLQHTSRDLVGQLG